MKNNIELKIIIQIVLVVLSFLLGGLFMLLLLHINPIGGKYEILKDETKVYEKTSLSKSIDKIYNATVAVTAENNGEKEASGTGFIYKVEGNNAYILTNEHILVSNNIKVMMETEEVVSAKVLGKDKYLDLAVLQIDKKVVSQIATIGSSEKSSIGDTVFTVGSPIGTNYHGTVTSGILSGKDRLVSLSVSNNTDNNWVMKVLQIDAPINPGNSGGPLLNINGEVIGVCTMKLVDDNIEGMGFAIPIEYAMSHIKSLEKGTKIKWPELGISMTNITDSNLALNNLEGVKTKEGVIITEVKKDKAAYNAGLKSGDIITKINDNKIKDKAYLRYELYKYQSGDSIKVTYIRENKEKTVNVVLSEK